VQIMRIELRFTNRSERQDYWTDVVLSIEVSSRLAVDRTSAEGKLLGSIDSALTEEGCISVFVSTFAITGFGAEDDLRGSAATERGAGSRCDTSSKSKNAATKAPAIHPKTRPVPNVNQNFISSMEPTG